MGKITERPNASRASCWREDVCDYAGKTMKVVDPETGEILEAQIFVAVLGASSYTFVEAQWSQNLASFIGGHVHAFKYFGGIPQLIVPDNLKSGVLSSNRYEPQVNRSYAEMAAYYGCAVLPARPRHRKDKAKVEVAVQVVERWILAVLRDRVFFSLDELNEALWDYLTNSIANRLKSWRAPVCHCSRK
ncbi:IS21 family transposase [Alicyclobacillus fastidiosus]|uniref:IS21 family transposase n=1 Tax=Alicyclobacillus fastidiosus TaxID=392011 RepID=A0ABV5AJB4_9BACL|nr:IS21 family transposase [Alicyclobacillus fastidiosus]WEH11530.1 IS21 family transposase [Alicyclobacillus fastidiosus]